jgi:hypothetical protein
MQTFHAPIQLILLVLLGWVALASAQSNDKPILWWRFDEVGGNKAYDASGNGNTGVFSSATMTRPNDPVHRGVVQQPSTYATVTATHVPELNPGSSNFTVTLWIKNSQPTIDSVFFVKGNYAGPFTSIYLWTASAGGGVDNYYNGSADISLGASTSAWKHLAVTRAGTSITTYANGSQVATGTHSTSLSNTNNLTLGGASDATAWCVCSFSDVRLYYRAMTAAEIRQVYREGLMPPPAPASVTDLAAALLLSPAGGAKGSFFRFFEPQ